MLTKIRDAALEIISTYERGDIGRSEAHELLNTLNATAFNMANLGLWDGNPNVTQEYIHRLQDKYTVEIV